MSEEPKINALVNLQTKVVDKTYNDLLSKPSKKAGNALATIVNVGNTMLWPIKWVNERTRIYFENNLKKYEQKLENISEEKITEVPTEISMPILERFVYTSNEELSNAFVNLLASASSTDTINTAHPGFIQLIDRISPDEAILLKHFKSNPAVPALSIRHHNNPKEKEQYIFVLKDKTGLDVKVPDIRFPENLNIYLNNLESLGLIHYSDYYYIELDKEFELIEKQYSKLLKDQFNEYELKDLNRVKREDKGMYELTDFGKLFISACIKE